MRFFSPLMAVAVVFFVVSSASSDTAATLCGKMTQLKYLVGTWACTTKIAR
jgi:hypothetical protein